MKTGEELFSLSKEELIALLADASREASSLREDRDYYKTERDGYKEKLDALSAERDRLRAIIAKLQRHQFGRRSERLSPDQLQLALEEIEQTLAVLEAGAETKADPSPTEQKQERKARPPRSNNRGALPAHLPREHHFIEPEDKTCPDCGGALHVIGEDVTEQLDKVPATLKVKVTHRPRYGCRCCECAPVQAPAPERPIPGGMPTEALLAGIVVDKYCDHTPLYRQAKIFARQGIDLDRQTLCTWVGKVCFLLGPIYHYILADILGSPVIFGDETTLPVLDPGRGKTKTGYLWAYARDERPWQGDRPPAVAYIYEEDRRHQHAVDHLVGFTGILHCDGYAAYDKGLKKRLEAEDDGIRLAQCNVHARRNFYDVHKATDSPIAAEALRRYAELYAIEADIRGCPADIRRHVRQERSRPLMDDFAAWLKQQLELISGGSGLAKAIRYSLARWPSLCRFLTDGRVEMDSNTVERAIRPQKLTVRNALFAGSDGGAEHWALVASILETCKLCGVEPFAYLRDTLTRITAGHTIHRIGELAPWNYKPVAGAAVTRHSFQADASTLDTPPSILPVQ
jgi:transposase